MVQYAPIQLPLSPFNSGALMIGFRAANESDIASLLKMINGSYRPDGSNMSWSNESKYMSGDRINAPQLLETLQHSNSVILVGINDKSLVSCVLIEHMSAHSPS